MVKVSKKAEGYTMKVNPLKHKDFKGLYLNEIDERILLKNTIKGERMY